ncbi:hypothetical protein QGN29_11675 [Temperatibacter marinus]|uniref:Uncharacterized protein n=1 Tax=Temperatibacter marinus TaxID=1456591 RepID=A0AA52H9Z9_9PROT|nr:hypothetical protein [Temperatibacter marinus]WND02210.1 hypothetical protein QGN29_11675 [Temperatibacter marinus]
MFSHLQEFSLTVLMSTLIFSTIVIYFCKDLCRDKYSIKHWLIATLLQALGLVIYVVGTFSDIQALFFIGQTLQIWAALYFISIVIKSLNIQFNHTLTRGYGLLSLILLIYLNFYYVGPYIFNLIIVTILTNLFFLYVLVTKGSSFWRTNLYGKLFFIAFLYTCSVGIIRLFIHYDYGLTDIANYGDISAVYLLFIILYFLLITAAILSYTFRNPSD